MTANAVQDAATIILLRDPAGPVPRVLMGRRADAASFMPAKYVFPGGVVSPEDKGVPMARPMSGICARRLTEEAGHLAPATLAAAAVRELWEETGLILGRPHRWLGTPPEAWRSFAATGHLPAPGGLRFVFRALTPPDRPRRFDARFFVANAAGLSGDPDDFSRAGDELSDLAWVPIEEARHRDLPFITSVVLAEVAAQLPDLAAPATVPFFRNDEAGSEFLRLAGDL
ncbi:NUDIX hydrolase [Mesobaculum littorinae]|uniref:NUDIX hydrolase n=1 Tax=Mesobaculum littorinae TaxID=2486419 RepID=A0A438AJB4_9RHOB|nr:NUDIX hydrolase [Mesobaculum littorinae]RVV98800.1 NUDIX hydrolase [Mesobaculum littorinae]